MVFPIVWFPFAPTLVLSRDLLYSVKHPVVNEMKGNLIKSLKKFGETPNSQVNKTLFNTLFS